MKREMRGMKMQNLTQMLNYCENVSVCQRKILVEHFGEVHITRWRAGVASKRTDKSIAN